MIRFNKLTTTESEIYWHGEIIGTLQKIGEYYQIEILYNPVKPIHESKKSIIKKLCKKIYFKIKLRDYNELVKKHKLRNSAIRTNYQIVGCEDLF